MHLISFDASPRQLSKLRNGHAVRIKKGKGFNLVVNPSNYKLVSRAFTKNKGLELKLSPEELEVNETMSPEQHEEMASELDENLFNALPFAEGGSIFRKAKRGLKKLSKDKTLKNIEKELRPLTREMKKVGKEVLHENIAKAHQYGAERYGDDEKMARLMNVGADLAHSKVQGGKISMKDIKRKVRKTFNTKPMRQLGNDLKPLTRALKSTGKELLHENIAKAHMYGADRFGDDPRMAHLMNVGADLSHSKVQGMGLGCGLYAYPSGRGMNAHEALRLANMATAQANHQLAKMHNATVHGQLTQPPIKRYWNDEFDPPSRGYGINNHHNLIRGRGSLLRDDDILPPALQSQPFGANFHMQFFLPPEYHKFNDGTDVEGRGLYV